MGQKKLKLWIWVLQAKDEDESSATDQYCKAFIIAFYSKKFKWLCRLDLYVLYICINYQSIAILL